MDKTIYMYAVHSDIDEQNIYAEFDNKAAALDYARRHIEDLTWVDEVEVLIDEDGDIIDELNHSTVWVYTDELDSDSSTEEDDFFAFKDEPVEISKVSTDDLVERLEENEDMVECKECFDLFPKDECTKLEVGYICPNCRDKREADIDAVIIIDDEDLFKLDFPEVEKFSSENEMIPSEPEIENDPISTEVETEVETPVVCQNEPISSVEVVNTLISSEEEAVGEYTCARDNISNNPEIPEDVKDDILDTLEHIKEEEEEHIEELAELIEIKDEDSNIDSEDDTIIDDVDDEESEDSSEILVEEEDLVEHVNEERPAIESDQKLVGTDNAVVDCEVADVITHSEDEKPVDCKMEKKPLAKPLTEATEAEMREILKLSQEIGIETISGLDRFNRDEADRGATLLDRLRDYRAELGPDFKLKEAADLQENARQNGGFRTDGYRTVLACYDTDDFNINVEFGMADEDEYEVEDEVYLLCPGQTVADLVVYLSRECGFTSIYVHGEHSALRHEIKTTKRFETVSGDHDYRDYGTIDDRLVEEVIEDEDMVRCAWCNDIFDKSECHKEVDLGYLCSRCEAAIKSRGEELTFVENSSLTESSLKKGGFDISPTEHISWGWDKNDGFYVEKIYLLNGEEYWRTDFRNTYNSEESARRAFEKLKNNIYN